MSSAIFGRNLDRLDHVRKPIGERLLPDVAVVALAAEVGAVVLDVLALFHLRGDRAAARRTGEKAHERVQPLPRSSWPVSMQDALDRVECRSGDDRFVRALVAFSKPHELEQSRKLRWRRTSCTSAHLAGSRKFDFGWVLGTGFELVLTAA
jgi:hypothetical protein